jgi:hypothetical protein
VYDLSGPYQFVQTVMLANGSTQQLTLNLVLQQNSSGVLHSSGETNTLVGSNSIPVNFKVQGRVSGGGAKPARAVFLARWQTSPTNTGTQGPFLVNCLYTLNVTPAGLSGTAQGTAKLGSQGSGRLKSTISGVPLPNGVDGTWGMMLDVLASKGVGGVGSIVIPNGRSLQGNLVGKFSGKTGLLWFRLGGIGTDRGSSVQINFFPHNNGQQVLTGRVLGQTVVSRPLQDNTGLQLLNSELLSPSAAGSGQAVGQSCVECHSQFVSVALTGKHSQIGIQCQSCHGPTSGHAANPADPVALPMVDLTGTVCGTCHNGPKHPIFDEWASSGHSTVVSPTLNPDSCGRCHYGDVRFAMLHNEPLPPNPGVIAQSCPVCHDPHGSHTHTNVLAGVIAFTNALTGRGFVINNTNLPPVYTDQNYNPLNSTQDYFITTSGSLTNQYDPNINICGQCHNHRGASFTSNSRPPHESPQYNMLLGTVGVEPDGSTPNFPAEHSVIEKQCVACHMQTAPSPGAGQPAISGHTFEMNSFNVCAPCHASAANAQGLANLVQNIVTNQITAVKKNLDLWGTTKAPPALQSVYGPLSWEYINGGALSSGNGPSNSTLQAMIPINIQKARFNLYLVFNDGSLGIHNPFFALHLLGSASDWVQQELSTPSD